MKPKYTINHKNILENIHLNGTEKIILQYLLIKDSECEINYHHIINIVNQAFQDVLKMSYHAFLKHRNQLENEGFFEIMVERHGMLDEVEQNKRGKGRLFYFPNYKKLEDLGFIEI